MSKELANTSDRLSEEIAALVEKAKQHIVAAVNSTMTATYYYIGRMIVEHEQGGKRRAEYGTKLLPELAKHLTERFGKGFSKSNLANMRQFYLMYSPIFQTLSGKSVSANLQTLSAKFPLSWSHYLPKDNTQIFASKYELVLPDKKELMRLLEEKFTDEE